MKKCFIAIIILMNITSVVRSSDDRALRVERLVQEGRRYQNQGNYGNAESTYKRAIDLALHIGYHDGIAKCYHQIGTLRSTAGEYIASSKELEKAIDMYDQILAEDETNVPHDIELLLGRALSDLGVVNDLLGNERKAERNFSRSIKILKNRRQQKELAICHHNMGVMYRNRRDFERAVRHCQIAAQIQVDNGYKSDGAITNSTLGSILYWRGALSKRDGKHDTATELFYEANTLFRMAYHAQKDDVKPFFLAITYHNMASLHYELSEMDSSIYYFKRALKLQKKYPVMRARTYNGLALVYFRQNRLADALSTLQKAINLLSFERDEYRNPEPDWTLAPDIVSLLLADKGRICREAADKLPDYTKKRKIKLKNDALNAFKSCLKLKKTYSQFDFSMLHLLFVEQDVNIFDMVIDLAIELYELSNDEKYLNEAVFASELKKRMPLRRYYEQFSIQEGDENREIFEKVWNHRTSINSRIMYPVSSSMKSLYNVLETYMSKYFDDDEFSYDESEFDAKKVKHKSHDVMDVILHICGFPMNMDTLKVRDIVTLNDDEVVITYLITNNLYILYKSNEEETRIITKKGYGRSYLNKEITDMYNTYGNDRILYEIGSESVLKSHLREMYRVLLSPDMVRGKKCLTIIPSEYVNLIPFQCLIDSDGDFLIEHKDIRYLSSMHSLKLLSDYNEIKKYGFFVNENELQQLRRSFPQVKYKKVTRLFRREVSQYKYQLSLIDFRGYSEQIKKEFMPQFVKYRHRNENIFGDSNINSIIAFAPDPHNDLKYSRDEVEIIAKLFPESHIYSCESQLKNEEVLANMDVLHIATHSDMTLSSANDAALLFCEVKRQGDEDGRLHIHEIEKLNLSDKKLVTLSSCSTSRLFRNGEEFFTFAEWFLKAGSPTVVASQWQAHDRYTMELMISFYKNLTNGKNINKLEAFCMAQRNMIKKAPISSWASFIYIGQN